MQSDQSTDPAVSLLDQIADTALDDDYYIVRATDSSASRQFSTPLTALVIAIFALMVTVAALQTRNDRPATERERSSLISNVTSRKAQVGSREVTAQALREEVAALRAATGRVDPAYEDLRVLTGDRAAEGPGVTVTANPSRQATDAGLITDNDLQILVNGLWYAGAEAVSINGNRIGTLTAIRSAGDAITVNFRSIGPPYEVTALGNEDTLGSRFIDNPAGRYWEARRLNAGVRFDVTSSSQLSVPAVPKQRITVTHATAIKGER